MVLRESERNQRLAIIATPVMSEGNSLVNPSVYLRLIAHIHSNKPAMIRNTQSIRCKGLMFLS
jgi:hypothetical protein